MQAKCTLLVLTGLLLSVGSGEAQIRRLTPEQAAAATELPVTPWGPYSRRHAGPCFLASRAQGQLFAFPVVVGQRQETLKVVRVVGANGKATLRPERVALERRLTGLFPSVTPAGGGSEAVNGRFRVEEANADGLYWKFKGVFPTLKTASENWAEAAVEVEYFPVNAASAGDGLLIRVRLTNPGEAALTCYVDLLGGMDSESETFAHSGLNLTAKSDTVAFEHSKNPVALALAADGRSFPDRAFRVGATYFASAIPEIRRDASGVFPPVGTLPPVGPTAQEKPQQAPLPNTDALHEAQKEKESEVWGLVRVDNISVPSGKSVVVWLGVGLGKDQTSATETAQSLLALAEDRRENGNPGSGLYSLALAAHKTARFANGEPTLERLLAQSLVNIPLDDLRRVGVPTRETGKVQPEVEYRPAAGGLIALGWTVYRPDWAAAQLNAHFLTFVDATLPVENPQAIPPTNLFALWELYQRTLSRPLITKFYPHARRRYQELLKAGRREAGSWLFVWPEEAHRNRLLATLPSSAPGPKLAMDTPQTTPLYAPDYSAYVIRSAKLLRVMAELARRPAEEIQGYDQDVQEATLALNRSLWNPMRGLYAPGMAMEGMKETGGSADTLASLLPLIAGASAQNPEQREALLKHLTRPEEFWSDAGLRSVSKASPQFHAAESKHGAVHFGVNWLFWKALLDAGEAETARTLANGLLHAYRAAARDRFPDSLNGDTATAGTGTDFTGDACVLLPLYAAYHTPGTVSSGWDMEIMANEYTRETNSVRLVWHSREAQSQGVLLYVTGKPKQAYRLTGALETTLTSDEEGVLTIVPPRSVSIQQLHIAPTASDKGQGR